jgi:hypothetical protein
LKQNTDIAENKITVATCCYDKDWKLIFSEGYLKKVFSRFKYQFNEKIVIINTDNNRNEIIQVANREKSNGNIDNYFFASDLKKEVLDFFNIEDFLYVEKFKLLKKEYKKNIFVSSLKNFYHFYFSKKGCSKFVGINKKVYDCINYSIGPLCAILKSTSDYLLYFTEDCLMDENTDPIWIDKSIELINSNDQFFSSRPIDDDLDGAYFREYGIIDDFYICYPFTDRMFLSSVEKLRSINFNCENAGIYPPYGGAGFEARVYNYMRANDKKILISKKDKYIHEYDVYMDYIKGRGN